MKESIESSSKRKKKSIFTKGNKKKNQSTKELGLNTKDEANRQSQTSKRRYHSSRRRLREKIKNSSRKLNSMRSVVEKFQKPELISEKALIQISTKSSEFFMIYLGMEIINPNFSFCFELMEIFTLNLIVYSDYLANIFQNSLPKYFGNIKHLMSSDSFLSLTFRYFDLLNWTEKVSENGLILLYISLILFLVWILKGFLIKKKKRGFLDSEEIFYENKKNFSKNLISLILANYSIFFFLINYLVWMPFFCHKVVSTVTTSNADFLQMMVTDLNVISEIDSTKLDSTDKKQTVTNLACILSDTLICNSTPHYAIITFSVILFLLNLFTVHISYQITSFLPNIRIRQSNETLFNFFFDFTLSFFILGKTYVENSQLGDAGFKIYYLSVLAFSVLGFIFLQVVRPYYNVGYRRMKGIKIILLVIFSGIIVLENLKPELFLQSEKSSIIEILIFIVFVLKVNQNSSWNQFERTLSEFSNMKNVSSRSLVTIYYRLSKFISKQTTENALEDDNELNQIKVIMGNFLSKHKETCRNISCFCKRDFIFRKSNSLFKFKKIEKKENFILETLIIMNLMFKSYFRMKIKPNEKVFICYIDFLTVYLGKPALAYKYIYLMKNKFEKILSNKMKIGVLLLQLENLAFKNLKFGILAMRDHQKNFKNDEDLVSEKIEKYRIINHVAYLHKFENMKVLMKKAIFEKSNFLREMLKINPSLKVLNESALSFYCKKKKLEKIFYSLSTISKNNFSPLYCLYGYFMLYFSEDKINGVKQLNYYKRIAKAKNLNKVFCYDERRKEDALIMKVESDPKVQKITYVTSNVYQNLGKLFFLHKLKKNIFFKISKI